MGHIQNFERELRSRIDEGDMEELITWLKGEMLQSYRNGLSANAAAGEEGQRVGERAGKSFRRSYKS